ncbi:MAG: hypothetical protein FWG79_08420 [Bacteroidales bacterium]|nr:hypothetical protein [Bacteroidales bacterium]
MLKSGTYTIFYKVELRPFSQDEHIASVHVEEVYSVSLVSATIEYPFRESVIASDGLAFFATQDKFFYYSKQSGLQARFGNAGIRLTNNALQKYTVTNGWVNL